MGGHSLSLVKARNRRNCPKIPGKRRQCICKGEPPKRRGWKRATLLPSSIGPFSCTKCISCVHVLRAFPCAQIVPLRWQQGRFLPVAYHFIIIFLNAFVFRSPVFSSSIDTPLHALDLVRTESWPLTCSSDMAVGNLGISQRRFSPRLEMCPLRLLMLFFNVYPVTSVFLSSLCMWDLLFCRYRIWLWCFSLVESPNAQLDTLSFP